MHKKENLISTISIVTTLFNSSEHIEEFCSRIHKAAITITPRFDIILVDDGSTDNSVDIALNLRNKYNNITLIELSRNFGHHQAIMTGLMHARGEYVFLINSDLEESPELLIEFWSTLQAQNDADVIYGIQKKRPGSIPYRLATNCFMKVLNLISDGMFIPNINLTRLMKKRYVEKLCSFRERELVFVGLAKLTGYKQIPLEISRSYKGSSTYTFKRRLHLAINYITSFTNKPLVIIFYLGLLLLSLTFIAIIYIFIKSILYDTNVSGWTSIILSIWLFGSLAVFTIGIVGLYISKIFIEVKNRPCTITKSIHTNSDTASSEKNNEINYLWHN